MSKSSRREIFDALTSDSSRDGCDGDWRYDVMNNADKHDVEEVKRILYSGMTESEAEREI